MELWTGFIFGLLSSLHCVGMCGPIVLALPAGKQSRWYYITSRLIYNSGRVITYALLGGISGWIGEAVILTGYQKILSITLGIVILVMIFLPSTLSGKIIPVTSFHKISSMIRNYWSRLFNNSTLKSLLLIGILNGFLPCGLVYIALAGAASTGRATNGFLYMIIFGLGTVPAMVTISLLGNVININFRRFILRMMPVGGIILAVLIILRGLSLGIPYLSPKISGNQTNQETVDYCHPVEKECE